MNQSLLFKGNRRGLAPNVPLLVPGGKAIIGSLFSVVEVKVRKKDLMSEPIGPDGGGSLQLSRLICLES